MTSRGRLLALAEAVGATTIWSTSFVVSQIALRHMGPITVVACQYVVAFMTLLPFMVRDARRSRIRLSGRVWAQLIALGLIAYCIGNGTLIWGLQFVPAATAALLLTTTPLLVMTGATIWLGETPTGEQMLGAVMAVLGGAIFFASPLSGAQLVGIGIISTGVLAFCAFSLIGRDVARTNTTSTVILTGVPFGTAGAILTMTSLAVEGLPNVDGILVGVIAWLGVLDTAVAYGLYNHALNRLSATEMSAVIGLTPLGTAALEWVWLGQRLTPPQITGMICVVVGVLVVESRPVANLRARRRPTQRCDRQP